MSGIQTTMDIENEGEANAKSLVLQDDQKTYEDAYVLNGFRMMTSSTLVEVISLVLGVILKETDKIQDAIHSSFSARSVPSISIKDYLMRVAKNSQCSDECFILGLIYIDRITERNKNFVINSLNTHRLLLTAIMLAAKFFDDKYYNNEYYARIGGISKKEINQLEIEFLNHINFALYVDPMLFFRYRQRLLSQVNL